MEEEAATSSTPGQLAVPEGGRKIQIYSTSSYSSSARQVTPFWKEKYEKDAKKYWDLFYKRHQDRFFKDRHYLDKEWGDHFLDREVGKLVVLEVGCGAGNTIFPLVATYPHIFVHACDFSPRAIELVKTHANWKMPKLPNWYCDLKRLQILSYLRNEFEWSLVTCQHSKLFVVTRESQGLLSRLHQCICL